MRTSRLEAIACYHREYAGELRRDRREADSETPGFRLRRVEQDSDRPEMNSAVRACKPLLAG